MEQQRALNALEPYLALSKSATSSRAAADLIAQATSAPQTYVFAELLQTPNIQALKQSPEYVSHLRLLEIFAWGTFADYQATPGLPPLNPQQQSKLRLLSILPLCTSQSALTYSSLQSALSLPSSSDLALESLITSAIYANLITAHLDPLHRTVCVTSVAPLRDLSPNSIPGLLRTLDDWEERCTSTLSGIEAQVAQTWARAKTDREEQRKQVEIFEDALDKEAKKDAAPVPGSGSIGNGGLGGAAPGIEGSAAKKSASSRWGSLLPGRSGKRAAPTETPTGGNTGEGDLGEDVMDYEEYEGTEEKEIRAAKRKGAGLR